VRKPFLDVALEDFTKGWDVSVLVSSSIYFINKHLMFTQERSGDILTSNAATFAQGS
jgi:hypothetical protein